MLSLRSIFNHMKMYTISEAAKVSKQNSVYSFLKLLLEAEILSFKDSYLRIPTSEKMAFKVLVPFLALLLHLHPQNDFCIPINT